MSHFLKGGHIFPTLYTTNKQLYIFPFQHFLSKSKLFFSSSSSKNESFISLQSLYACLIKKDEPSFYHICNVREKEMYIYILHYYYSTILFGFELACLEKVSWVHSISFGSLEKIYEIWVTFFDVFFLLSTKICVYSFFFTKKSLLCFAIYFNYYVEIWYQSALFLILYFNNCIVLRQIDMDR